MVAAELTTKGDPKVKDALVKLLVSINVLTTLLGAGAINNVPMLEVA
jgi:hypothetical protein